jgi:hypothetical protein
MLWGKFEIKLKNEEKKRQIHRYDHLPLLPSGPGGIQQELVICRHKSSTFLRICNHPFNIFSIKNQLISKVRIIADLII